MRATFIDRRSTAYSSALTLIEMLVNGMGISLADRTMDSAIRFPF